MHSSVSAAIAIGVVLLLVLIAVGIFNIWRRFAGGGGGCGVSGEKVDDLKEKIRLAPKDGGKEMESLLQQVIMLSLFTH